MPFQTSEDLAFCVRQAGPDDAGKSVHNAKLFNKHTPMKLHIMRTLFAITFIFCSVAVAQEADTLPVLKGDRAPQNFEEMWAGFDPHAEPLEVEILNQWEEDGVVLRVVRFRIGVFKGQKAKLAGVYGFPKDAAQQGTKLPGLLQIHGGGQYADANACLQNAKRGYATLSIAWAGRISSSKYRVSPGEVKLFWDDKTDDPRYRPTTDWGAVDGYHAPSRNQGNQFPSAKAAAWTLDSVESPRNSGWFLCALAARRALTFLERQPEVDPSRLGVYGHSMGGKLTVMTSVDPRVKAAAPSCGGISDRDNDSPLFRATIGDDVSLKKISCPIIFLSPANDFHGRIGDLPRSVRDIATDQWRVTCAPHHNHQDTAPFEVATMLWFDEYLKGSFQMPRTPESSLQLDSTNGVPTFSFKPDPSRPILSVDVFYTQDGKAKETRFDTNDAKHRMWHHVAPTKQGDRYVARLPLRCADRPLWVYANIRYGLEEPVTGAGYYYGTYTANSFNVSSLLTTASPEELAAAGARPTLMLKRSLVIEDFEGDWEKEWFTYKEDQWERATHKVSDRTLKAPADAKLALDVQATEPNKLVVMIDAYAVEISLNGGEKWQQVVLAPEDFKNYDGESLSGWDSIRRLKLSPAERLRSTARGSRDSRIVGKNWSGENPKFRNLRWQVPSETSDDSAE